MEDSFKFQDVRVEKANAVRKYRKIQRITSLFRFVEVFVFLIVVSRFSTQFAAEYLRGISAAALISPRSVFVVGNAIVIVLFLISRQFAGERSADFYDEYVEKCRSNNHQQQTWIKPAAPPIGRSQSANLEAMRGEERRRNLRRSMSDKCRKKAAEEEMSSEDFRRTVEAFIARQQRSLREEEEEEEGVSVSAVVSCQA